MPTLRVQIPQVAKAQIDAAVGRFDANPHIAACKVLLAESGHVGYGYCPDEVDSERGLIRERLGRHMHVTVTAVWRYLRSDCSAL